ncbi:MAG: transporter [Gammaproteobacteria bacterium]
MVNRRSNSKPGGSSSFLWSFSLLVSAYPVFAGDLNQVVTDLYGGNGIFVQTQFHTAHFSVVSFQELDNLNTLVTSQVNNIPVSSSNVGYSYDVAQGIVVRRQNGLGPLLSERAWTVGKGILNVGYAYERIDYDTLNGQSLSNLQLIATHQDCCDATSGRPPPDGMIGPGGSNASFELDEVAININLQLVQQVHSMYATFGITDNWDVGLLIPIIQVNATANAVARVIDVGSDLHRFDTVADSVSSTGGSAWGIGDMHVRSKYTVIKEHEVAPDFAVALDVTMPTGDEKNLLGTGYALFRPTFIVSKQFGMFTPHVNVGYQVSTAPTAISNGLDNLNYIVGVEAQFLDELTTAFDFLGKWFPSQPNSKLENLVDAGFQVRWNPIATTTFNGFVIIPVNGNNGLRSDAIWGLGLEHSF